MTDTVETHEAASQVAARLTLSGRVQGVGMRPAVARFARQLSLVGSVDNTHDGVEIHVQGPAQVVNRFERELPAHLPVAAEVTSLQSVRIEPTKLTAFVVGRNSELQPCRTLSALVPPDVVACDLCLTDVLGTTNHRHRYPFTSCTTCGPRYSIIERMPYERERTSMAGFPLCDCCSGEYASPADRRFHSQTNACPDCGPQVWLRDADLRVLARGDDTLRAAASTILDGRIVALRGLGGYQLLVDATSQEAVERLRRRKQRHGKPLAVMVASLAEADTFAQLDDAERRLLCSPAGPIVIAAARSDSPLAPSVTAELNTIGLMLSTTLLHWLLLASVMRPLICTSANIEGEPLVYEINSARDRLRGVADLWLEHNRPIRRPIDDSVVRVMAGQPVTIRLARGYAPFSLGLTSNQPLIALGGHQKTSVALCNNAQSVLGPHIGDLETVATRQRFVEQVADLSDLYGIDNPHIACDQHPEYFTTEWAESQSTGVVRVQHHHAHIVAGMLEHGWLDRQVLGVSFDGTGYGTDGTIWGGEFLLATSTHFERVGHLRPFSLAGGQRAVRQPWRVAMALVREAMGTDAAARLAFQTGDAKSLLPILRSPTLSPTTTSAGRLFDGVAALVLGVEQCEFEGQAAMLLESAYDSSAHGTYDVFVKDNRQGQLDWCPLVRQVLHDRASGVSPCEMATRFHRGLANAIFDFCRCYSPLPVVLGGGVFQNRVLVELLAERFAETNQPIGLPGRIPMNDGGLAAGQLAVAAALAQQRSASSCA